MATVTRDPEAVQRAHELRRAYEAAVVLAERVELLGRSWAPYAALATLLAEQLRRAHNLLLAEEEADGP